MAYTIEQVDADDAKAAADHEALKDFYADDTIWQHENCGTECDGADH